MKSSTAFRVLWLILPGLVLCASVRAQGVYSIEGRVLLPNGEAPTVSVRVTVTHNGIYAAEVFTDLSGRYYISGLERGSYVLTAHGDGETFEDSAVRVDIGAVTVPQSFTVDIDLKPKRPKDLPPAATVSAAKFDPDVPENARKEYLEGVKLQEKGDSKKAIEHFASALNAYPRFFEAALALGDELSKKGNSDRAAAQYRTALEIKPDNARARMGLGIVLVNQKKFDQAVPELKQAVAQDPTLGPAFLFLGMADVQIRQFNEAEQAYLRAVAITPGSIARVYLADLYEKAGYYKDAIDHLQAYLKENPKDHNADAIKEAIRKLEEKAKNQKK